MLADVGPYRVMRLIGQGGQGRVYLGYDDRLGRPVAIKRYTLPSNQARRRALLAEARAVARMQGPQVVQVFDVIESRTHLAMVMEYVPGCTLERVLRIRRLSLASAVKVAQDLAAALTLARQRGIVHGDLKASNVLITTSGRARLVDFGVARHVTSGLHRGHAPGSLSALSPEQYRGEAPDHRSDLFALGIVLYRMLCGAQPFYRKGQFDAAMLLRGDVPPLLARVSDEHGLVAKLLPLVNALLRVDPARRIGSTLRVRQLLLQVSRALPAAQVDCLLREVRPLFCEALSSENAQRLRLQLSAQSGQGNRRRQHHLRAEIQGGAPQGIGRRGVDELAPRHRQV